MIQEATAKTFDSLIDTEYAVVDCYGDFWRWALWA